MIILLAVVFDTAPKSCAGERTSPRGNAKWIRWKAVKEDLWPYCRASVSDAVTLSPSHRDGYKLFGVQFEIDLYVVVIPLAESVRQRFNVTNPIRQRVN